MLDMHIRPSEILGIDDTYLAFCFDETCAFIISKIKEGEKPILRINDKGEKTYSKPSDLYRKYDK